MRYASKIDIQHTPVWNEVKNWGIEEKQNLITLLYSTMDGAAKPSFEEDEKCEILANQISKDLLQKVGEYALEESRAGRCIPHAQAMDMVKERMGWK